MPGPQGSWRRTEGVHGHRGTFEAGDRALEACDASLHAQQERGLVQGRVIGIREVWAHTTADWPLHLSIPKHDIRRDVSAVDDGMDPVPCREAEPAAAGMSACFSCMAGTFLIYCCLPQWGQTLCGHRLLPYYCQQKSFQYRSFSPFGCRWDN